MLRNILNRKVFLPNVYGPLFGLFRSGVAFSHLLILVFTGFDFLIRPTAINPDPLSCNGVQSVMTFCIFPQDYAWIAKILGIMISLFVISGYFPRASSILFSWEAISFKNMVATPDGGDQIAANLSIMIVFLALFDNRKNHWHKSISFHECLLRKTRITWSVLGVLAIKIQMAYLYFESGLAKTQIESWADGSEVYYVLSSP